jgi:hypothetical protein
VKLISGKGCLLEFLFTFIYWAIVFPLRFWTAEVESGGICMVGVI